MNIPTPIAEQMASIESEIVEIERTAASRVKALRERLDIYSFVVGAFVGEEETKSQLPMERPRISYATSGSYDYDALINLLRAGPPEGLPKSMLPIDHPSRLSVLLSRGIAKKLPSGNWVLAK